MTNKHQKTTQKALEALRTNMRNNTKKLCMMTGENEKDALKSADIATNEFIKKTPIDYFYNIILTTILQNSDIPDDYLYIGLLATLKKDAALYKDISAIAKNLSEKNKLDALDTQPEDIKDSEDQSPRSRGR